MRRSSPARAARGVTFLEMVLAVSLLAILAAASFSALDFVMNMQRREQQRLGAAELGSALIIQFLDDRTTMPPPGQPVEYGAWLYHYSLSEVQVPIRNARPVEAQPGPAGAARPTTLDRIRQVTVRVWLAAESGGADTPEEGAPSFALTRLIDPLAVRNPDSFDRLMKSEAGRRLLGEEIMGAGQPGAPPPPPRPQRTPRERR